MNAQDKQLKRRAFLRGSAAVAGAGLAVSACGTNTTMDDAAKQKEITQLNALLTAEYKALDAYAQGAAVLTAEKNDMTKTQAQRDLASLVLAVAGEFIKDHTAHAALLDKTVKDLGGAAVAKESAKFTLPTGFKASTVNVMKLAANEERRAAIAYNGVIKELGTPSNRFISAAIEGDETQHYMVLAALIEGLAVPTMTIIADQVVPRAFVATTVDQGGEAGLEAEADISVSDNA
ncbi:MAG: ferritin-like domain-containing protein [Myxococcaceae bacterium]